MLTAFRSLSAGVIIMSGEKSYCFCGKHFMMNAENTFSTSLIVQVISVFFFHESTLGHMKSHPPWPSLAMVLSTATWDVKSHVAEEDSRDGSGRVLGFACKFERNPISWGKELNHAPFWPPRQVEMVVSTSTCQLVRMYFSQNGIQICFILLHSLRSS